MEIENLEVAEVEQDLPQEEGVIFVETARFSKEPKTLLNGRNQEDMLIGAGIGAGAVSVVSFLALLRERKIKNNLFKVVEQIAFELSLASQGNMTDETKSLDMQSYCNQIIAKVAERKVRSLTNPFGLSRKDTSRLIALLQVTSEYYVGAVLSDAVISAVNVEDIEATVTPVTPQEKEGK